MKHLSILLALAACVPIDDVVDDPCYDGNTSWNTAVPVQATAYVSGTLICDSDEDWYRHALHPDALAHHVRVWAKAIDEPIKAHGVLDPVLGLEYLVNPTTIFPEDGWVEVMDVTFQIGIHSEAGFMIEGTEGALYAVQFDVWSL